MIDGYADFEEIGRGGFSHVYRATQVAFGRVVAVKVIDGIDPSAEQRSLFARECRAVGSLHWHPNIITVFDAGTTLRDQSFIAMEYAPAGSLAARVAREGSLSETVVRNIGTKIASALQAAHDAGILHRDVKPANILINEIGEPVLADFGIASVSEGTQTNTGNISATLAHAAPEVLNGERATASSDVYALGSTLFTLFAGKGPYSSGSDDSVVGLITRALTAPIPDLTAFGASAEFASAVARAMSRDPKERFSSARDFAAALSMNPSVETATERVSASTVRMPRPDSPAVLDLDDPDRTILRGSRPTAPANEGPRALSVQPSAKESRGDVDTSPGPTANAPTRKRRGLVLIAIAVAVAAVLTAGVIVATQIGDKGTVANGPEREGTTSKVPGATTTRAPGSSTTIGPSFHEQILNDAVADSSDSTGKGDISLLKASLDPDFFLASWDLASAKGVTDHGYQYTMYLFLDTDGDPSTGSTAADGPKCGWGLSPGYDLQIMFTYDQDRIVEGLGQPEGNFLFPVGATVWAPGCNGETVNGVVGNARVGPPSDYPSEWGVQIERKLLETLPPLTGKFRVLAVTGTPGFADEAGPLVLKQTSASGAATTSS